MKDAYGFTKPLRITLEQYDHKITIEKNRSDIDLEELADMLEALCLAAGWSQSQVDEIFGGSELDRLPEEHDDDDKFGNNLKCNVCKSRDGITISAIDFKMYCKNHRPLIDDKI
jgi:hypothetical protein